MRLASKALAAFGALAAPGIPAVCAATAAAQGSPPIAECAGVPATIFVDGAGFVVGGPLNGKRYAGRLTGTPGPDVILGTSGADIISGGGGNDLICGLGGRDTINGGAGNDLIDGGGGGDLMNGGPGIDTARKVQASDRRIRCEVNAAIAPLSVALDGPALAVEIEQGTAAQVALDVAFTHVHAPIGAAFSVEIEPANGGLEVIGLLPEPLIAVDVVEALAIPLQANTPGDYLVRVRVFVENSSVGSEIEIPVSVQPPGSDAAIVLTTGLGDFVLEAGEVRNITYAVHFANLPGASTATFTQELVGESGGILLDSDAPAQIQVGSKNSFVFNTICTGVIPGEYAIRTTVTLAANGTTVTESLGATIVMPGTSVEQVFQPTIAPPAVKPGVSTPVLLRVAFSTDGVAPVALQAQEVGADGALVADLSELRDDGLGSDDLAGDGIYSGTAEIDARPEGDMFVIVRAPSGAVSDAGRVRISPFHEGCVPSDPTKLITIASGFQVYGGEIVVRFAPGTPSATVSAAATLAGGTVLGMLSTIDTYQFALPGANTAAKLSGAKAILEALPDVELVELNESVVLEAFQPDSSGLGTDWFAETRLHEARVVASGSAIAVAVVDTGVDATHSDLAGSVLPGKNLTVNPITTDTSDTDGHGTGVASVLAGAHNGTGMTGASAALIIPFKSLGSSGGSALMLANAILEGAASSARIVSVSISVSKPSEVLQNAVLAAHSNGKLVVAAAGNQASTAPRYPCAYPTVLCVGATSGSSIASFSNRGPHVDIAAPGTNILHARPSQSFALHGGTSFSTPIVSGIAALVWSRQPGLSPGEVRNRLTESAKPMLQGGVGSGIVDAFGAVFNGSFELVDMKPWSSAGTVGSIENLGTVDPQDGKRMCMLTTGPAGDQAAASMQQSFTIQPGVPSPLKILVEYAFVSEEFPEFVGTVYNDNVRIVLVSSSGQEYLLGAESVNESSFQLLSGVQFPGGDSTTGWTGWKTGQATIPNAGGQTFRIEVRDAGDDIYDSAVLIDDVRFE